MHFGIVLFTDFETLDAFGPAEMFGRLPSEHTIEYYSAEGGMVKSGQNAWVQTQKLDTLTGAYTLVVPGGGGTRKLVEDEGFLQALLSSCEKAAYVLTVCTGSALLAKTGYLNGKHATSNKMALNWAMSLGDKVLWEKKARWVVDGTLYTSSGISAGMDMALGFIGDQFGEKMAREIATVTEYIWHSCKEIDPFAK